MKRHSSSKGKISEPVGRTSLDSSHDVPVDRLTILLRAFVRREKEKGKKRPPEQLPPSNWVLILDTETTTDASQRVRFGSYQLRLRGHLRERGVFYNPEVLTETEIAIIQSVIAAERARAIGERINVMSRDEFVENIFLGKAYALGAVIVGFNLPFDLSRLAIDHGSARGKMKGGFSFILSKNTNQPHLRAKHLNWPAPGLVDTRLS